MHRPARTAIAAVTLALGLLAHEPARAQQPDEIDRLEAGDSAWTRGVSVEQRVAAQELFRQGNALLKETLFAQAADKYTEALDHWDLPAIHYNLAIAQFNLAKNLDAYESIVRAMAFGADALGDDKFEEAKGFRRLLENQLIRIEVICQDPGAEVILDGKPLFEGPARKHTLVPAGAHQIVARKPDYHTETVDIAVSPGDDKKTIRIALRPVQVKAVRRWDVWKPWAVALVGAGLVAGAGYLDWRSSQRFGTFNVAFAERCGRQGCLEAEIPDLVATRQDAEAGQQWARGIYAIGGATLITGAVLLYLNRERLVSPIAERGVHMSFSVSREHTRLSARVRF